MDDKLLTTSDVSELTGLSIFMLRKWRRGGFGPKFVRLGYRTVRYRLSEVEAFIAGRTTNSTTKETT